MGNTRGGYNSYTFIENRVGALTGSTGFNDRIPWTRFGGLSVILIGLGLTTYLVIGGRPDWPSFVQAESMLPVVVLFAVINAFGEEITRRAHAGQPGERREPQERAPVAAQFFGLARYFGQPYGVIGMVMARFQGRLLGKAMLEARGYFWAWLVHFPQNALISSFVAAGSGRGTEGPDRPTSPARR